jgi:hypothetical protein
MFLFKRILYWNLLLLRSDIRLFWWLVCWKPSTSFCAKNLTLYSIIGPAFCSCCVINCRADVAQHTSCFRISSISHLLSCVIQDSLNIIPVTCKEIRSTVTVIINFRNILSLWRKFPRLQNLKYRQEVFTLSRVLCSFPHKPSSHSFHGKIGRINHVARSTLECVYWGSLDLVNCNAEGSMFLSDVSVLSCSGLFLSSGKKASSNILWCVSPVTATSIKEGPTMPPLQIPDQRARPLRFNFSCMSSYIIRSLPPLQSLQ